MPGATGYDSFRPGLNSIRLTNVAGSLVLLRVEYFDYASNNYSGGPTVTALWVNASPPIGGRSGGVPSLGPSLGPGIVPAGGPSVGPAGGGGGPGGSPLPGFKR